MSERESLTASPPWLLRMMQLQFHLNCLSSVAIEIPALRPKAEALRKELG